MNDLDWQVGDKVFDRDFGEGVIKNINFTEEYPIFCSFPSHIQSFCKNGYRVKTALFRTLFHLDAVTFDRQDRPIAFDYNFRPERKPQVKVTKLPHEFEKGEEVLVKDCNKEVWTKRRFAAYDSLTNIFRTVLEMGKYSIWKCVIPFKGNEHCEDKVTNCESGKIPEDYVLPKQEYEFKPFDKVLVRGDINKTWRADLFSHYNKYKDSYKFDCVGSGAVKYCIPFKDNEHLLGTTNDI